MRRKEESEDSNKMSEIEKNFSPICGILCMKSTCDVKAGSGKTHGKRGEKQ